ncbi:uncharacterized protein LOC125468979 isoform X2 [Pyrus x bretschneideri]|uniref:uncharacterized protein LOC125468979 isoform X2 n=1 Tax=Pyrus x bretschneideri TaxID=225117 RepID=UPI00202FB0F5|nr:uncharacterized protein LOC125468979 isoform X2 [Pyrus x bretschneideri]
MLPEEGFALREWRRRKSSVTEKYYIEERLYMERNNKLFNYPRLFGIAPCTLFLATDDTSRQAIIARYLGIDHGFSLGILVPVSTSLIRLNSATTLLMYFRSLGITTEQATPTLTMEVKHSTTLFLQSFGA